MERRDCGCRKYLGWFIDEDVDSGREDRAMVRVEIRIMACIAV
jgi:hypothetical protein